MYNNRSLFSDYYLEELVVEDSHWRALKAKASDHRERIGEVLKKAIPGINGDTPEAEVERRLIRPILDNLGHVYFVQPAVPSSEGVRRPDYALFPSPEARQEAESHKGELEFFKTALAVGDAKAWERSLDKRVKGPGDPFTNHNPSYQIDFYLRATERKWGLLTNGRHWRLYHRDLSYRLDVYYEVALPQVITLDEDAFLYFLAFFHKNAFQPDGTGECFLDRAYRASTEYAARVSEELKDNVYEALRLLAEGLLSFPGNGLKDEDLDLIRENAFIVIYRLLFILYAEAGELLPVTNSMYSGTYSLRALTRAVATKEPFERNLHPTATGYWSRLQDLFRLINSGDDDMRIPPYNGRLFDDQKDHQSLATWKIGDRYLAAAIDQLARARAAGRTGRGFVSYRDLSIRELGSIYEGLLEHRPRHATQDVAVVKEDTRERFVPLAEVGGRRAIRTYRAGSVYLETDKGERKATGSYYTPQYIVEYIVRNTLGPLLEEAKKSDGNLIDAILSLKVLDPAMGSGHFLVEATDYLARALVEALGGDPREMEEDEIRWARREVVERCIYGVDLNPLAVDLAKLSLWLSTVSLDKPLNFLDHHLRYGNSLIGARLEDLGQLPVLGKKKAAKAAPASQGLLEYFFHQNVATAVDNYFRIAAISSDKLQDIRDKEKLYGIARDILKRYRQVAHIWTSVYFGNEAPPDGYMILQDKIRAPDPEWADLEKEPWFANGVRMGEEERRFFHWELEFPEVFFDRNGQRLANPGFSVVVGNPPYGQKGTLDDLERGFLRLTFEHFTTGDTSDPFAQRSIKWWTNPRGNWGFIIPKKITYGDSWANLRADVADLQLLHLVDASKAFEDVLLEQVVVVASRKPKDREFVIAGKFEQGRVETKLDVAASLFIRQHFPLWVSPSDKVIWLKISQLSEPLVGENSRLYMGLGGITPYLRSESGGIPCIKGADIYRYGIRDDFLYLPKGFAVRDSNLDLMVKPKILVQRIVAHVTTPYPHIMLMASLDEKGYLVHETVTYISQTRYANPFICGLLNSTLMSYIVYTLVYNRAVRTMDLIEPYGRLIPIRRINFTTPKAERERLVGEAKRLYYDGIKKAALA